MRRPRLSPHAEHLRDETWTRDVSQEALLKIGKALNGSAHVKDYDSWVLSVAGNTARDALRQGRRRRELAMEEDLVDERSPEGRASGQGVA